MIFYFEEVNVNEDFILYNAGNIFKIWKHSSFEFERLEWKTTSRLQDTLYFLVTWSDVS